MIDFCVIIDDIGTGINSSIFDLRIKFPSKIFLYRVKFSLCDFEEVFDGRIIDIIKLEDCWVCKVEFNNIKKFIQSGAGIFRTKVFTTEEHQLFNAIYSFDYTEFCKHPDESLTYYFENEDDKDFFGLTQDYSNEIYDLIVQLKTNNKRQATRLLENTYDANVHFTPEQVLGFIGLANRELLNDLAINATIPFTRNQLDKIEFEVDIDVFDELCNIAGVDYFELFDLDLDDFDEYLDEDNILQSPKKVLSLTNGYDSSWFNISLADYKLEYASNSDKLFLDICFEYSSLKGNRLVNLDFYITNIYGTIIKYDGYLSKYGEIPHIIDIRMDGESHTLRFGPSFPIKSNDSQIVEGISFNVTFEDKLNKFLVRKSYFYRNGEWYDEEFLAIPL